MKVYIKPQIKWTEEKIEMLKSEYPLGDKSELAKKLGIKESTLKDAARRFRVKSLKDKNFYKLKILFDDTYISNYWLGFILADGFVSQKGQLSIYLSIKDYDHISKLAKYLNANLITKKSKTSYGEIQCCGFTSQDSFYGIKFLETFDITKNKTKTYNSINPSYVLTKERIIPFLLGFCDGDGCFSKNPKGVASFLKIEVHNSWIGVLSKIGEFLKSNFNLPYSLITNSRGYADFRICKKSSLKFLKDYALNNSIPILERKWNCVEN